MFFNPVFTVLTMHSINVYRNLTQFRSIYFLSDRFFLRSATAVSLAFHMLDGTAYSRDQYNDKYNNDQKRLCIQDIIPFHRIIYIAAEETLLLQPYLTFYLFFLIGHARAGTGTCRWASNTMYTLFLFFADVYNCRSYYQHQKYNYDNISKNHCHNSSSLSIH